DAVGAQDVAQRQRMWCGWHVGEVERGEILCVLEDHRELAREPLDLVGCEREARQRRDVLDLGAGDAVGHEPSLVTARVAARLGSCTPGVRCSVVPCTEVAWPST